MNKNLLKKIKFMKETEGISMIPIIYPEDSLYLQNVVFSRLKVNDIAVFQKNNELITHRVIYKTRKYFITKGDNNCTNCTPGVKRSNLTIPTVLSTRSTNFS